MIYPIKWEKYNAKLRKTKGERGVSQISLISTKKKKPSLTWYKISRLYTLLTISISYY